MVDPAPRRDRGLVWLWRLVLVGEVVAASATVLNAAAWAPWTPLRDAGLLVVDAAELIGCVSDGWGWAQFAAPAGVLAGLIGALSLTWRAAEATLRRTALLGVLAPVIGHLVWSALHDAGSCTTFRMF